MFLFKYKTRQYISMKTKISSLAVVIILFNLTSLFGQSKEPVDYVNPLIGTHNSRWMMFPGPTMPFGMVKLSPDNRKQGWKAGYEYTIHNIAGFSFIHSWTMAGLLTMPTTGTLKTEPGPEDDPDKGYRSRFSHKSEKASPGYYSVFLKDYDIKAELTATTRTGFERYTFPKAKKAHILFDFQFPSEYPFNVKDAQVTKISNKEIKGYVKTRTTGWNVYTLYFVAQVNKPFKSLGGWTGKEIHKDITEIKGEGDMGVFMNFSTSKGETINLRVGISLVSTKDARLNLETEEVEPFGWNFSKISRHARNTWNSLLSKIEVKRGSRKNKIKFYTNLYRAYNSRTIWSDVNGKYVGPCEDVQQLSNPDSPMLGSDAFWNTFWNLNQLWTLVTPDVANKWVRSFLEMYKKNGWLPKGPTGLEYSGIMVASHEIPLMVSAYQKGIRNYDVNLMYKAIIHNQTTPGRAYKCGGYVGNESLWEYEHLGYIPTEARSKYGEGRVSNTLEYAYDDWTVSQLAKALDKHDTYEKFKKRAGYWKNVYDTAINYVRPRNADGSWQAGFDPYSGKGFVEGNSWQYTWFVPQDVQGLANLMGKQRFNKRLNKGFQESEKYKFGDLLYMKKHSNAGEYEAMTHMPINHGNQPNMQAAYLFNYSGKPWLTQKWARKIMDLYYDTSPLHGWLGDEDEGQMGAWFVMSAMGLFEMRGGAAEKPEYEIGSPLFDKIIIHLNSDYYSGKTFAIVAKNNSKKNIYIQSATLNGKPLDKPWIYHSQIVKGGKLVLNMGPKPNKNWGSDSDDAPPSMSGN
jgi:predicted alpha-1,2-mannosidase